MSHPGGSLGEAAPLSAPSETFEVLKEQCAGEGPFSATPRSLTPLLSAVRGSDA